MALRKHWQVIELALGHCPFTFALQAVTPEGAGGEWCVDYDHSVVGWLAAHPEIGRVFVSNKSRVTMVVKGFAYRTAKDQEALSALPASVTRIYVLRDIPMDRTTSHRCVATGVKRHQALGPRCAIPRSLLVRDPTAAAARRLYARGARVIDLTDFFCSRRACFPVVGGVLTHKDRDHMTAAFSATLGPYLARAVDAAG
jgi:SGNH domain-containing protein